MFLAYALSECEDELICDFAETYHIYDLYGVSVAMAAKLAVGLRAYSRTMMKLNGEKLTPLETIATLIFDKVNTLVWFNSKDGQQGINRPDSLYEALTGVDHTDEYAEFTSGEEFKRAWDNA